VAKAIGKEELATPARRVIPREALAALVLLVILSGCPAVSFAAITVTTLAQGSGKTVTSSFTTASFTPAANTLILAWVTNSKDQALYIPTLSNSNGLNWVQVDSIGLSSIQNPSQQLTLFRAMGASPSAGSVTINFPATQKNCAWTIVQFDRVDITGSNGSGAVQQYKSSAVDSSNGWVIYLTNALQYPAFNASVAGFANNQNQANVLSPGAGYTATPLVTEQTPNISLLAEWMIPGSTTIPIVGTNSTDIAGIAVELNARPTTTLGNGTDPGNANLAPGGAATMADSFTFQTDFSTGTITAVTVTLAPGSSSGLGLVEITDSSGSTVYGSLSNPASDTPTIALGTNITATTTPATYKIRITPRSHAGMPPPPGSTYSVTAYVSNWSDLNLHAGSDVGGTTITIDNQSPANVTAALASRSGTQVALSWTNPADADLGGIVVLRKAGSAVTDTPAEGASYLTGNTVGGSTVACVVTPPAASCTDTGLTVGTSYYYKIFARDTNGNYSANGVDDYYYLPDLLIKLSSEGDAAFLGANLYETTATSQVKTQGVVSGSAASYKVRVLNAGTHADDLVISGTGSGSNFTVQYLDDSSTDRTAAVTGAGSTVAGLAAGAYKDWTVNVTPNGGATPVAGGTAYNVVVTGTSAADPARKDQVKAATSSTSANVTLLKSADKGSYNPGEDITYTIVASNGASLTSAGSVAVSDPIPANTGFKVGGAAFAAGSSTLTGALSDSNGGFGYTPVSGGCSAPAGYDYCVTQVKWTMTGSMPTGASFTCTLVVRVK